MFFHQNRMLTRAVNEARRLHPLLVLLCFAGVMIAASAAASSLLTVPLLVWLLPALKEIDGLTDLAAVMALLEQLPAWLLLLQLFLTVTETAAALIFCRKIEKRSLASMGLVPFSLRRFGLGYGIGTAMILAAGFLCVLTGTLTLRYSGSVPVGWLCGFFLGYLVQGMAEEVLLRGFLLVSLYAAFARRTCTPKQAALFSLLISSGLFAALHLSNPGITPLAMCNLFLAGISFGLFVLRTDDLWGACAMHAAWNFVMGHILGIPVSGLAGTEQVSLLNATFQGSPLLNGGSFGLEGGLFVTLVECASIALFLFLPRRPKPMQMEFLG